jgi:ribonucleoside-diphosphate reductase alpha subunit
MQLQSDSNNTINMQVIKIDGRHEKVSFDKILRRIEVLCTKLKLNRINAIKVAKETINGLYDGITTEEIDHYAAVNCAEKIRDDPQYDKLASALCISRLHKMTVDNFMDVTNKLLENKDNFGKVNPLITEEYYNFVKDNIDTIQNVLNVSYKKDYDFDYFGFKTLERAYLHRIKNEQLEIKQLDSKKKDKKDKKPNVKKEKEMKIKYGNIIERPQHMWMRVALGLNYGNIENALETYECLSNRYFTFGSPTLYNSGSKWCQCSSCFLLLMGDSLDEILEIFKDTGLISKRAGGIGICVSNVRASGSLIRGTNGTSSGIIPMIQVLNWLGRYVNQGGRRNGAIACFCKDTEVFTANEGVKKIQDVKIGDLVVTHKNRLRPVVQTHKNHIGDRKIYKLQVLKSKDIYVTGNHRFWSFYAKKYKSDKLSLGWNSIEELKEIMDNKNTTKQSCYVSIPSGTGITDLNNYKIDVMDYEKEIKTDVIDELKIVDSNKVVTLSRYINGKGKEILNTSHSVNRIWNINEDLANLFGMWLGDGHIRKSKTDGKVLGIGISVHKDNKDELDYIHKVCKEAFGCGVTEYNSKRTNVTKIYINSCIVGLIFMELFGSYFDGKKLPNMIFNWPKKLVNSLIAGLITTDGHISKKKCNATLGLSNRNLIDQLYHLCRNNGIDVSFIECKITKGQAHNDYTISIPLSKDIINQTHKFYTDDRIERYKKELQNNNIEDSNFLKIVDITEVDRTDEYVYTLGVEEDHSYTVDGFIVENCYIEPWHADVFQFCELRKREGKEEERARDIFLALWIPDLFMKRVEQDGMWSLMCPDECPGLTTTYGNDFEQLYTKYESEGRYKKQVRAKDLWFHILSSQVETGMPYMLYKDNVNRQSNQMNVGVIQCSNLCSEIVEYTSSDEIAVCNLASLCLPQFIETNEHGEKLFNFEKLKYISGVAIRNLNNVIDINYYPVEKAKRSNLKHRPIGLGVQGLADVYCIMEYPYDSDEARKLNRQIFETIYFGSLSMSNELAKKHGPYETFNYNGGSPFSKGQLQYHLWGLDETNLLMDWDWKTLVEDIKKYGTRNSLLTTIMPTASTSQIMGFVEACEPLTTNVYTRTTLAGEFTVINKYLVEELIRLGLWNKDLRDELLYDRGSVQQILSIPDNIKLIYKTAFEIRNKPIVQQAIERGPFIDQSQSLNLFCKVPDFEMLTSSHFYTWRNKLKTGLYYLRTQPAIDALDFGLDAEVIKKINKERRKAKGEYNDSDNENDEDNEVSDEDKNDPRLISEIEVNHGKRNIGIINIVPCGDSCSA